VLRLNVEAEDPAAVAGLIDAVTEAIGAVE
jgi:hypothetical protein